MKRYIPHRVELFVFLAMAVICAVVVSLAAQRDLALFACTLPMFLVAALLGFRRSELGRIRAIDQVPMVAVSSLED
ncbi:MAG TPA: hypothetical protein VH370_18950 [Humisphaera sp.]|jgi:hypothetical protein|nr:hypothetical protein [Humisphaera sp.]